MSRIKDSYKKCSLRCTTPVDGEMVGVGFNLDSGEVVRLSIPVSAVVDMHKAIVKEATA